MNRKAAMLGLAALVAVAACGGAEEPSESGAAPTGEEAGDAPPRFTVF
jgi:hypothetical protein